jgi:hypothetical protein
MVLSILLVAVIVKLLGLQPTWGRAFGFAALLVLVTVPVQLWLRRRKDATEA